MYLPEQFQESRLSVLHDLIRSHPFGALVVLAGTELLGAHLPFLLCSERGDKGTLCGHVARANPVWKHFGGSVEALAIFQGPHAYISPSWYPSKETDGRAVPTWNYAVVHAYGAPRAIEDPNWLHEHVTQLSAAHEAVQIHPWNVSDAPHEYIGGMISGIVGVEIQLSRLEGKWKASQNRHRADQLSVAAALESQSSERSRAMAQLVRQRIKDP